MVGKFNDLKVGDKKSLNPSDEEYLKLKASWFNEAEGNLNEYDGVNCDICHNKGVIEILSEGRLVDVDCTCKKKRIIINRLLRSGVSRRMLDHYKLSNFKTEEEWQTDSLAAVKEYLKALSNDAYWLYISGTTGVGKTHLCVGAFQRIVATGKVTAEYMNWNEESIKLITSSKSFDSSEYDERLTKLQDCDVLYIDDFLKLSNMRYSEESLSLAFRVLDYRYRNGKATLISSEISVSTLSKMDSAIAGRINEMTDYGKFILDLGTDEGRNYRRL